MSGYVDSKGKMKPS